MFLIVVALGCFLAVGCDNKKSKETARTGTAEQTAAAIEEVREPTWEGEYECKRGDAECRDYIEYRDRPEWRDGDQSRDEKEKFYFGGTVFNTVVNIDVTVRNAPSRNGEALFAAKKDTRVQVLGISRDGWAFVSVRDSVPKRGWLYGQFIDFKDGQDFRGVKTVGMKITGFNITAEDSSTADLTAEYEVNNVKKTLTFGAFKGEGQTFFTFFNDAYVNGSHYAVMPGVYTWDFTKNQLKHETFLTRAPYIFYNADLVLEETVRFSDDRKFFFIGDVKEYGVQEIYRTSDKKRMLGWGYYGGCGHFLAFGFKDNTVTVACPTDNTMAQNYEGVEEMDSAVSEFREEYTRDNPNPSTDGSLNTVEVLCEIDLETGVRKITGGRWMYCE
jgi:hypothetical protein